MGSNIMKKITRRDLSTKFPITKQDYQPKATIEGVKILEVPYFSDEGGALSEIAHISERGESAEFPGFHLKQVNWTFMTPGTIKAGHVHFQQEDIWMVPPTDRLLVGLLDLRKSSKTYLRKSRLVLGAGKSCLLYIPRGVAHGAANLWNRDMMLLYFVNQRFTPDPKACDENRIPAAAWGKNFWSIPAA
jgi:dTDP-4-dehydrorhamnose 3,5-epimerase